MDLSIDAWLERYPNSASGYVTAFSEGLFDSSLLLPMTVQGDYCLPLHGIFAPRKYQGISGVISSIPELRSLPVMRGGTVFLGQSNYWHFLLDGLATLRGPFGVAERLYFREDIPDHWIQFVIDSLSSKFVHCKFSIERMRSGINRLEDVRCPWVGSLGGRIDNLRKWRSGLVGGSGGNHRRAYGIWVSRRGAFKRRLLNEDQLLHIARQRISDLVIVDPVELSIPEQIGLFSGASYVLGPHGAGLANSVFSERPRGILELWHSFRQTFFHSLAETIGCGYVAVEGRPVVSKAEVRRHDDLDFTVSISDFRYALDALLAKGA